MRGIGNAHSKCTPGLDVLHSFMAFGQIQDYGIPFLHAGSFDGHLADYINIRPDVRREFVVLVEF